MIEGGVRVPGAGIVGEPSSGAEKSLLKKKLMAHAQALPAMTHDALVKHVALRGTASRQQSSPTRQPSALLLQRLGPARVRATEQRTPGCGRMVRRMTAEGPQPATGAPPLPTAATAITAAATIAAAGTAATVAAATNCYCCGGCCRRYCCDGSGLAVVPVAIITGGRHAPAQTGAARAANGCLLDATRCCCPLLPPPLLPAPPLVLRQVQLCGAAVVPVFAERRAPRRQVQRVQRMDPEVQPALLPQQRARVKGLPLGRGCASGAAAPAPAVPAGCNDATTQMMMHGGRGAWAVGAWVGFKVTKAGWVSPHPQAANRPCLI